MPARRSTRSTSTSRLASISFHTPCYSQSSRHSACLCPLVFDYARLCSSVSRPRSTPWWKVELPRPARACCRYGKLIDGLTKANWSWHHWPGLRQDAVLYFGAVSAGKRFGMVAFSCSSPGMFWVDPAQVHVVHFALLECLTGLWGVLCAARPGVFEATDLQCSEAVCRGNFW